MPCSPINPVFGMRISTNYDPCPVGFTDDGLVKAINAISDNRHDYDMLMESARFEEVDSFYNPGTDEVSDDFVLEAIVVDKFSKTERRMAAVVRVLNRHLGNSEIKALDAIIGKPRKTGSYAYVTVQLPFSDGQVVSVIFHAPEGDKKKIGPSDQIIAFRWLLNKRDITQVVAPEDGSEISLESIAKRLTQLVVKNSARFERTQKEAQKERQELDKAREDLKEAEKRQSELLGTMATASKEGESIEARLSNTLALLEKQKSINAELQAKLDTMKKTQSIEGSTNSNSSSENRGEWFKRLNQEASGKAAENVNAEKIEKARQLIGQISQYGTESGFAFTNSTERYENFYSKEFGETPDTLRWNLERSRQELIALKDKKVKGMSKKEARALLEDRIEEYTKKLNEALLLANDRYDAYIEYLENRLVKKQQAGNKNQERADTFSGNRS